MSAGSECTYELATNWAAYRWDGDPSGYVGDSTLSKRGRLVVGIGGIIFSPPAALFPTASNGRR